jgi:hypothetical protein
VLLHLTFNQKATSTQSSSLLALSLQAVLLLWGRDFLFEFIILRLVAIRRLSF